MHSGILDIFISKLQSSFNTNIDPVLFFLKFMMYQLHSEMKPENQIIPLTRLTQLFFL